MIARVSWFNNVDFGHHYSAALVSTQLSYDAMVFWMRLKFPVWMPGQVVRLFAFVLLIAVMAIGVLCKSARGLVALLAFRVQLIVQPARWLAAGPTAT